ncbi:MAG: transketolase [Deltaproteobacteria bacterium]|nr:transketolase [Deltaproteobacteria bacterium]
MGYTDNDKLCINTIRTLSIDAIQRANSGHPGLPMGAAPMAYVLWQNFMKHNPKDPQWANRDRFVLSAGHGSMLLYSLLHLTGYDLSMDDVKNFRQWGSKTAGHPESFVTPGVECTTGPLGQGCANGVGMAMAERHMAHQFNRPGYDIVDHHTYILCGDGDLMEGISAEAASLAGHLGLGKLVMLYDSNDISLDGPTSLSFTENVGQRYESYGWQVLRVEDGDNDLDGLHAALEAAKADTARPTLIEVKTTIGFGSPNKAGSSSSHGSPLGGDEIALTKKALNWPSEESFFVPTEAAARFSEGTEAGAASQATWEAQFEKWSAEFPELKKTWDTAQAGELPEGWDANLPTWEAGEKPATRASSGKILNQLAQQIPFFFGGDADLSCSTKTALGGDDSFNGQTGAGRNIHYGVREHAMGAIANGMAYHGGVRTYTATFFCFVDYMKPAVRLAALNNLPTVSIFTHDSIGLGEDGPTHQPVEHLASLRCIPNVVTLRPCDGAETAEAWRIALERNDGPSTLVLSRQGLPELDRTGPCTPATGARNGAYVLSDCDGTPEAIIIASGSEITLALQAQESLKAEGKNIRVVSMPSWELFRAASADYKESVLPKAIKARLAVEAGATFGWERWVGDEGDILGVDRFGTSAPADRIFQEYGFTVDNVVSKVKALL